MKKRVNVSSQTAQNNGRLSHLWQKLCLALSIVFAVLIVIGSVGLHVFSSNFTTNSALSSSSITSPTYLHILLWVMPDSVTSEGRAYYVEENPDYDSTADDDSTIAILNALRFYYYEEDEQGTSQKVIVGNGDANDSEVLGVAFLFFTDIMDMVKTLQTVLKVIVGVSAGGLAVTVIYAGLKEADRIEKEKIKSKHTAHRARKKHK